MCTNDSNSDRGSKTSSPLCLPSNKRLRRDECVLGTHQITTGEYNSANLAMFMVNVSHAVSHPLLPHWPEFSVNDLKTWFRSRKYVVETLKLLPEMPEPICI